MLAVVKKEQVPALWPFLSRRAQRILPPYYAAVALPLIINFLTGGFILSAVEVDWWPITAHLLLIHDLFADTWGTINNVLWSVSVEWRIYLLFPFFSYLYLKYGIRVLLGASAVVFAAAVCFCLVFGLSQVYSWTGICPQYVILFALGMACSAVRFSDKPKYTRLRTKIEQLPWKWLWIIVILLFVGFLAKGGALWRLFGQGSNFIYDIIIGLFAVALLLYASYLGTSGMPHNLFSNTKLAKIGLMAYSIYLVHYPVLQLIANIARDHVPTNPIRLVFIFTVGLALVYGGAHLFYRFIERPFASPKKKASAKDA